MRNTRRHFTKSLFGSAAAIGSSGIALFGGKAAGQTDDSGKSSGVRLGVCTYSFRELPRENGDALRPVLNAMKECSATICELFSPQIEPEDPALTSLLKYIATPGPDGKMPSMQQISAKYHAAMTSPEAAKARADLRKWRLTTPPSYFENVRRQFQAANIDLYAYTLNFSKDFTDEELDKCFLQAKTLGVKTIASSTQVSMLPRLKPLAERHQMYVALHGHSDTKHPDEFSSPETFAKALAMSPMFRVNLDIGHFAAGGFDPVAYIQQHHDHITHLHIKDRKRNDGPNQPFGRVTRPSSQS